VPALADLLTERLGALVAAEVTLTTAAVRAVVETLGGGRGRREIAAGNRLLAEQVGVNVRTVQRWQKEPGAGEARDVTRTRVEGVTAAVQGIANVQGRAANVQRLRAEGLDVDYAEGPVRVSNDRVARVRRISQTADGDKVHLDGEAMGRVLDAWDDGGTAQARVEAADLFGSAVLDQYGIAASAEFTDMRALALSD
jgi:hypothetical protein